MLNAIQLHTMLDLQNKMNSAVDQNWLELNRHWHRAIIQESAEAQEHHGWKWWKKQVLDLPQFQMEMIDVWHFALSAIIVEYEGDLDKSSTAIASLLIEDVQVITFDGGNYEFGKLDILSRIDLMIGLAAAKRFSVPLFLSICEDVQVDTANLYRQYVGKNVLNIFRQDNGYKDGTYIKEWHGREDNEQLFDILNSLDIDSPSFSDDVYNGLKEAYPG